MFSKIKQEKQIKTITNSNLMNPFEKLKLTIDRIGLEYVPSDDNENITGETVYKYKNNKQVEENQRLPYFNTQGSNQIAFKNRSAQFREEEIQELKSVYENQHKNLVSQINTLNFKLQQQQLKFQFKSTQNERLISELQSSRRENKQLRACIMDLQQKNARKMSESGVLDRERKLKEEIDRINFTVTELAKELNSQKSSRKSMQRQLQQSKLEIKQRQQRIQHQNASLLRQIDLLKEELQKRAQLLQHSIKSSRDDKIGLKRQLMETTQKYESRLEVIKGELQKTREQIYRLKNDLTQGKFEKQAIQRQQQKLYHLNEQLQSDLLAEKQQTSLLAEKASTLTETVQQLRLKLAYLKQQLQQQRSNTRVKVVQVHDESLLMQLDMYKKQCKELLKEKSIWESVRKNKSDYTIVCQNKMVLNRAGS